MKKMLKRAIIAGIILCALVTTAIVVLADGGSIRLSDAKGELGNNITINMTVGPSASGADVYITYDKDVLGYVSASDNTGISGEFRASDLGGRIRVYKELSSGVGEIKVSLSFGTKKAGTTYVGVDDEWVTDALGDRMAMDLSLANAEVVITGSEPAPETPSQTAEQTQPPHQPSSEARLRSLSFQGGGALSPAFNPDVYEYRLTIPSDVDSLEPSYATLDEYATAFYWPFINRNNGATIPYGETEFTVRVTSENKAVTKDYTVIIVRPEPETSATEPPATQPQRQPSSEARLRSLSFQGGGELSPAFNPDVYNYRLTIPSDVDSLDPRYDTLDEYATAFYWPFISRNNDATIPYGETEFTVRVTSENEAVTKDYTVIIYRPEPETSEAETTVPPTEPDPTTEEVETTPEETTEEPDTTPEETTAPTEPADDEVITLSGASTLIRILPLPKDHEIRDPYIVVNVVGKGGVTYQALAPKGESDPDHLIIYGVPVRELPPEPTEAPETTEAAEGTGEETATQEPAPTAPAAPRYEETGDPTFYVYDRRNATLQRYGLIRQPETTEAPTQEPTEAPTEEITTQAPTAASTAAVPVTITPAETTASAQPGDTRLSGNLPWWVWLAILLVFAVCLLVIILLLISKDRLEQRLRRVERLTKDEEDVFLKVNNDELYHTAKAANPPKKYGMEDIEDLNDVLESEEK